MKSKFAGLKNNEGKSQPEENDLMINEYVKLTEEEAIDFLGNWNLVVAYTLLSMKDISFDAGAISQRMNILKSDAETILETLKQMKLVRISEKPNQYLVSELRFDDSFITSSDLLSIYIKVMNMCLLKLSSRNIFAFRFDVMSKKVIQKYQPEFDELMSKIVGESKDENDCEVYAFGYCFAKATRTKRSK